MPTRRATRRAALGGLMSVVMFRDALAGDHKAGDEEADDLAAAIRAEIGDAAPRDGGIALRLPPIAENGGQVPLTISIESPMTQADHVTAIHVFATDNPTPGIASFTLTPGMGRAEVQTRIRLARDQKIVVLAVLSDGQVLRATAETKVALGGCL